MSYYRNTPSHYMCRDNMPMQINRADINRLPLAMAYVPIQVWEEPYPIMDGLHKGTIFPSLDKPFLGSGGCPR